MDGILTPLGLYNTIVSPGLSQLEGSQNPATGIY